MKKKSMPSSSKPGIKRPKAKEDVEDDENDDGDPGEYGDGENGDDGESEDDEEQEDGEHEGDEEPSEEQEALKEDQIIAIMHQVLQKVDALGQMLGGGAPQMPQSMGVSALPVGQPSAPGGHGQGVDALVQKAMGR